MFLLDGAGDGFVNWNKLTKVHQRFIQEKYAHAHIKEYLVEYAKIQNDILLQINEMFSAATIGEIHDFLYHL